MIVYNGVVSDKIRWILGEFNNDAIVNNSDNSGNGNATKYTINYDNESDLANYATDIEFWELEYVERPKLSLEKFLNFKIL